MSSELMGHFWRGMEAQWERAGWCGGVRVAVLKVVPSGKHTKNYWKWHLYWVFPLKFVIFHSFLYVYQRVYTLSVHLGRVMWGLPPPKSEIFVAPAGDFYGPTTWYNWVCPAPMGWMMVSLKLWLIWLNHVESNWRLLIGKRSPRFGLIVRCGCCFTAGFSWFLKLASGWYDNRGWWNQVDIVLVAWGVCFEQ